MIFKWALLQLVHSSLVAVVGEHAPHVDAQNIRTTTEAGVCTHISCVCTLEILMIFISVLKEPVKLKS